MDFDKAYRTVVERTEQRENRLLDFITQENVFEIKTTITKVAYNLANTHSLQGKQRSYMLTLLWDDFSELILKELMISSQLPPLKNSTSLTYTLPSEKEISQRFYDIHFPNKAIELEKKDRIVLKRCQQMESKLSEFVSDQNLDYLVKIAEDLANVGAELEKLPEEYMHYFKNFLMHQVFKRSLDILIGHINSPKYELEESGATIGVYPVCNQEAVRTEITMFKRLYSITPSSKR